MPLEPFSPRYTEPNIKEGFRIRSELDQTGKLDHSKILNPDTDQILNTGSELRDGITSIAWVNSSREIKPVSFMDPNKVRTDLNQKPLRCKPET